MKFALSRKAKTVTFVPMRYKKLFMIFMFVAATPAFAQIEDEQDPSDLWGSSYESPFDKPKDRGLFFEDPASREDRIKIDRPSQPASQLDYDQGYDSNSASSIQRRQMQTR